MKLNYYTVENQVLLESLSLHVVSASWDLQFQRCLAEASRAKTTAVRVEGMRSGTVVSRAGKLFYDTLKVNNTG